MNGSRSWRIGKPKLVRWHDRRVTGGYHLCMIWYVALGSAVGGVLRYFLGGLIQERAGTTFPVQRLFINSVKAP